MVNWQLEVVLPIQRFEGKGAWTYVKVPWSPKKTTGPFGWITVSVQLDAVFLEKVKLLPFGDGTLFLPLSKALRRQLKKEAGDELQFRLKPFEIRTEKREELLACFQDEPMCWHYFQRADAEQQEHILSDILSQRDERSMDKRLEHWISYCKQEGNKCDFQ